MTEIPESSTSSFPTSLSALTFNSTHASLSYTLRSLKQNTLSLHNRLFSIKNDADFTSSVADTYNLPVIANERCGSWYIPPERKAGSAYFKSTDGHAGQWEFSLRRLNLGILKVLGENGGCIIVDSTRRGKAMPDALSKTVPIWTAVMNRALFPSQTQYHALQVPPNDLLGQSEVSQMEAKIDSFVKAFKDLNLPLETHSQTLKKPIQLIFEMRDTFSPRSPQTLSSNIEHNTMVLLSTSHRVRGAEMSEGGYIQGAGDDHESWAMGLTPALFWANRDVLLDAEDNEIDDIVAVLVNGDAERKKTKGEGRVEVAKGLWIGKSDGDGDDENDEGFDIVVKCQSPPSKSASATEDNAPTSTTTKPAILNLSCSTIPKLGSRDLRKKLPDVCAFVTKHTTSSKSAETPPKILVTCQTGTDLSAGTALMLLCLYYNDEGVFVGQREGLYVDKSYIKRKMAAIVAAGSETGSGVNLNPSRATLQSVNAALMS